MMVNNAGLQIPKPMHEVTPRSSTAFTRSTRVFFRTQVAVENMLARDDPGVIINTASISSNLTQYLPKRRVAGSRPLRESDRGGGASFERPHS
ncbi:hypothetical protein D8S78_20240 [Natrialba swarupiae]|nr:hypothetical protein [Natrialba swarupiae]